MKTHLNRLFRWGLLPGLLLSLSVLGTACNLNASGPAGSGTLMTNLKSYQLFSWQNEDETWSYALIAASREQASSEALIAAKLENLDQLKSLLFQLNTGTIVFWNEKPPADLVVSLPEGSVVAEIRQLANRKRLVLEVF